MQIEKIGSWTKGVYYKTINYNLHCFTHNSNPKINESIGYSVSIISEAIRRGIRDFVVRIVDYPNGEVTMKISVSDFLKHSEEIYYQGRINSDRQRTCLFKFWTKIPIDQKLLSEIK